MYLLAGLLRHVLKVMDIGGRTTHGGSFVLRMEQFLEAHAPSKVFNHN